MISYTREIIHLHFVSFLVYIYHVHNNSMYLLSLGNYCKNKFQHVKIKAFSRQHWMNGGADEPEKSWICEDSEKSDLKTNKHKTWCAVKVEKWAKKNTSTGESAVCIMAEIHYIMSQLLSDKVHKPRDRFANKCSCGYTLHSNPDTPKFTRTTALIQNIFWCLS